MRRVLLLLALTACGTPVVPSTMNQPIGPQGGSITISAADNPALAGTFITVPPGALSSTVVITITQSSQTVTPAGGRAAGPVVNFAPDGTTFARPVTIGIPVTLPAGATDADLSIEAVESTGASSTIPVENVSSGIATFFANGFTRFGGFVGDADGGPTDAGPVCECPNVPAGSCVAPGPAPCHCPQPVDCGSRDAGPSCTSDQDCGGCPDSCVNGRCVESLPACVIDAGPGMPDAGICACPPIEGGNGCYGTGPGPCFCPEPVPCDGGTPTCTSDQDCGGCPGSCVNGQCVGTLPACFIDGGSGPDSGVICACPAIGGAECVGTGPGPCFCPEPAPCDGGTPTCTSDQDCGGCPGSCANGQCVESLPACALDAGFAPDSGVICECPAGLPGSCTVTGPGPCFCSEPVPCDGGLGASDGGGCSIPNGVDTASDGGPGCTASTNGVCSSPADYTLTCRSMTGNPPQPDPMLDCNVDPLPTPFGVEIWCCPLVCE